jgi:hypothetical protein
MAFWKIENAEGDVGNLSIASWTTASHASLPPREENLISWHRSLYGKLAAPIGDSTPILFGWWPRFAPWDQNDLRERTTRCLPAVRPGIDVVALPKACGLQAHIELYCKAMRLQPWQVCYFAANTPSEALQEVFAAFPKHWKAEHVAFYPMYVTEEMQAVADSLGFGLVLGDAMQHSLGELANAKAWLHPHINPAKRGSSLRDVDLGGCARGPQGYIASSGTELKLAFKTLMNELEDGAKLVLKPSWASGGAGVILDVSEKDLESFDFPDVAGHSAILEEMIEGLGELQSPTLYMIGGEPCGLLGDQLLRDGGSVNLGNRWPSQQSTEKRTQECINIALALQKHWQLTSNWGLDYVIDSNEVPVIVDLNMGRPNGNFAVRLWESTYPQQLFLHTGSLETPADASCDILFDILESQGLLWNDYNLEGILVYQFLPTQTSSFVVASASGWARVDQIVKQFEELLNYAWNSSDDFNSAPSPSRPVAFQSEILGAVSLSN